MKQKPYRVQNRPDGVMCIYLPCLNVVVAEFSANTAGAQKEIRHVLSAHEILLSALIAIRDGDDKVAASIAKKALVEAEL